MRRHYSINENNQLLIKSSKAKVAIPVRGRFSVGKNNQLIYWLNEPASWRRLYNLPSKVSFIGNWQLNPNYDLELNLDETKSQCKEDRLILKGEIISTDRDTLAFEIISYNKQGLSLTQLNRSSTKGTVLAFSHIQLLKLTGSWQADEFNRITFFLTSKKKEPLGLNITFAHKFLKNCDAEAFLRLKDILDKKEKALEVGVRIPF